MNNGHNQNGSQSDFNGLVPFQPNAVITPETYTSNVSRLQTLKDAIALYEEQNNQAFMRYLEEKRRLEDAVEQGRLAAYVSCISSKGINRANRHTESDLLP